MLRRGSRWIRSRLGACFADGTEKRRDSDLPPLLRTPLPWLGNSGEKAGCNPQENYAKYASLVRNRPHTLVADSTFLA